MNNPAFTNKSLIPALFQIAARADELALKDALAKGRGSMAEMMLNAERLEAVLKATAKKKTPAARRLSDSYENSVSVSDGQMV